MTEIGADGQANSFESDTPVTICTMCGVGPVYEWDTMCEACAIRAGLELLEIFTPAEIVDGRVGIHFVCRGCPISCILKGNIDDTSGAVPVRCPWNLPGCVWEGGGAE